MYGEIVWIVSVKDACEAQQTHSCKSIALLLSNGNGGSYLNFVHHNLFIQLMCLAIDIFCAM
jgi:hypothetical protein